MSPLLYASLVASGVTLTLFVFCVVWAVIGTGATNARRAGR